DRLFAAAHSGRADGCAVRGRGVALRHLVPGRGPSPVLGCDPRPRGASDARVPRQHHLPDAGVHRGRTGSAAALAHPVLTPFSARTVAVMTATSTQASTMWVPTSSGGRPVRACHSPTA